MLHPLQLGTLLKRIVDTLVSAKPKSTPPAFMFDIRADEAKAVDELQESMSSYRSELLIRENLLKGFYRTARADAELAETKTAGERHQQPSESSPPTRPAGG